MLILPFGFSKRTSADGLNPLSGVLPRRSKMRYQRSRHSHISWAGLRGLVMQGLGRG